MASSSSPLVFAVKRREPEMIIPAHPTPYETKSLSDFDDRGRVHQHVIWFYQKCMGMEGRDPVKVLREAIARALVYYYPLAGRLRENQNHKLVIECTGEGVMFIEADARVKLEQFGDVIQPPIPCVDELLYEGTSSDDILNSPQLLIQVTRLMCGGFVLGIRFIHAVMDGIGLNQFLTAVSEMASGARAPSIQPVWKRELLTAQERPQISGKSIGGEHTDTPHTKVDHNNISPPVLRSIFIGAQEIAVLRNQLAPHLRKCSSFELLAACMWRCHTLSQRLDPSEQARLVFAVNLRTKCNPPLPVGFYGNALGIPLVVSGAGKLCQESMDYALGLIREAKEEVNEEFVRSSLNGEGPCITEGTYILTDHTHVGFDRLDFGWGKSVYGGATVGTVYSDSTFIIPLKNKKGRGGVIATICLPAHSMEIFVREVEKMIKGASFISSPL